MGTADAAERVEKLRAGDIMIPLDQYPKVTPNTLLREAIVVMDNAQLDFEGRLSLPRVLLVIDDEGAIVGHVRRRDVMRGLEPKFMQSKAPDYRKKWFDVGFDPHLSEFNTDRVVKAIQERSERPVKEIMLPIRGSLDYEDHFVTALYEMTALGIPLIPVKRDGRVVGLVRTVELFHELAQLVI
jgi:predicted transcriptional regulator